MKCNRSQNCELQSVHLAQFQEYQSLRTCALSNMLIPSTLCTWRNKIRSKYWNCRENKRGIKPKKEIKCCTMVNGSIDELIKEQGKL